MIRGNIMVVDDEATQRDALAQVLEQWGHEVSTAADTRQAMARLATKQWLKNISTI